MTHISISVQLIPRLAHLYSDYGNAVLHMNWALISDESGNRLIMEILLTRCHVMCLFRVISSYWTNPPHFCLTNELMAARKTELSSLSALL